MRQDNMYQALMNSAIHVVSEQGIHRATTKALAKNSGVNEAYIYRLFNGKEDLLKQTFASLDAELVDFWMQQMDIVAQKCSDAKCATKELLLVFWRYILSDREKCLFFIRYYYSQYYLDYSPGERKQAYAPVIERLQKHFSSDVDAWEELNHVYDVIFPTASRVLRGELQNSEELERTIYRRLYAFLSPVLPSSLSQYYGKEGNIS